jgi:hypothetical protein
MMEPRFPSIYLPHHGDAPVGDVFCHAAGHPWAHPFAGAQDRKFASLRKFPANSLLSDKNYLLSLQKFPARLP